MELDAHSQRIKDILRDMKYENKFVNSAASKKEELQQMMTQALHKKKKEIENILQRNSQLEDQLNDSTDERIITERAEKLSDAYLELSHQIKDLQTKEKSLLMEINNLMNEKENISAAERREIEEMKNSILKLKTMSHLYINFLRIRWIENEEKLYAYVAINNKDFKRFEASTLESDYERVNKNWEQLENTLA